MKVSELIGLLLDLPSDMEILVEETPCEIDHRGNNFGPLRCLTVEDGKLLLTDRRHWRDLDVEAIVSVPVEEIDSARDRALDKRDTWEPKWWKP